MDGVAARRLAGAGGDRRADDGGQVPEPGRVVVRRVLADERAALVVVLVREQRLERDLGVAVERVTVGEGELRALRDDVDELRRRELGEVEAVEERQLLQADRPGSPGQRLADGEAAVLERGDRLERRPPASHVVAGQEAVLGGDEAVDLLGDEALVVGAPRFLDLLLARAAAGLVEDAPVGGRKRGVAEERADLGRRQIEVARAGPRREQLLGALDRRADPGDEREPSSA